MSTECSSIYTFYPYKTTKLVYIINSYIINIFIFSHQVMLNCWEERPEDRPTFTMQLKCLSTLALMDEYIDIHTISNPNATDAIGITPVSINTPSDDNPSDRVYGNANVTSHENIYDVIYDVINPPTSEESSIECRPPAIVPSCNSAPKDDDLAASTSENPEKDEYIRVESCEDEEIGYINHRSIHDSSC